MGVKKLLNALLGRTYFKDAVPKTTNNVKRSWKRQCLRFFLRAFPRKVITSSPIKNENQEFSTKLLWLKEMQSSWAILVAVITVLGAMSLLFILHQEQILPVFMYTVDQPILLVTVALLSFASTLFLAALLNIHLFFLYEGLNGKDINIFTSFSVFLIAFLPFALFNLSVSINYFLLFILFVMIIIMALHFYNKYGSSVVGGLLLVVLFCWFPSLIIYYSLTTHPSFQEAFKEEWIGYLATALIYAYLVVVSMLIFDREKAFRVFLVITIVIILFLNAQIWRLASTYSGIKSQNTSYYLDDKTKYESETLFRFGKVLVDCNCTLETFDEKIETCKLIKDGKVQEQFTRVLPIK